jgi:hypothetical protein
MKALEAAFMCLLIHTESSYADYVPTEPTLTPTCTHQPHTEVSKVPNRSSDCFHEVLKNEIFRLEHGERKNNEHSSVHKKLCYGT